MATESQPPVVQPSSQDSDPRPFWSVMIPTYQPQETFLRDALASVLEQDRGSVQMQIEVVDDCSSGIDVQALVQRLAGPRVQFRTTERNLGLAGCWNACIDHARGEWVHILHQDDFVLPGFYAEIEGLVAAHPEAGAALTRHALADAAGHWQYISGLERGTGGTLEDWGATLASWQRIECAAIAVRRSAYVALGGFRTDLAYVLDWEMWTRVALHCAYVYSPKFLAVYRLHDDSESARLRKIGQTLPDLLRGFETIILNVAPPDRPRVIDAFNRRFSERVWKQAFDLFAAGEPKAASRLLDSHSSRCPYDRRRELQFLRWRCRLMEWRLLFRGLFAPAPSHPSQS